MISLLLETHIKGCFDSYIEGTDTSLLNTHLVEINDDIERFRQSLPEGKELEGHTYADTLFEMAHKISHLLIERNKNVDV